LARIRPEIPGPRLGKKKKKNFLLFLLGRLLALTGWRSFVFCWCFCAQHSAPVRETLLFPHFYLPVFFFLQIFFLFFPPFSPFPAPPAPPALSGRGRPENSPRAPTLPPLFFFTGPFSSSLSSYFFSSSEIEGRKVPPPLPHIPLCTPPSARPFVSPTKLPHQMLWPRPPKIYFPSFLPPPPSFIFSPPSRTPRLRVAGDATLGSRPPPEDPFPFGQACPPFPRSFPTQNRYFPRFPFFAPRSFLRRSLPSFVVFPLADERE